MKVSVDQVYTSVACNRIPEIVDWNNEGIICFGATNAVVIYDTTVKGKDPLTTLCHHRSIVNSVKWIHKVNGSCTELVSCSADKTGAIWSLEDGVWKVTSTLTGHTDGVTCVSAVYTRENDLVVYTASIDSTIRVWERCNGTTTHRQTIDLHSGLCLTLHAHLLPVVNKPVLFSALDDHKIHIFAGDDYHRVHTLVGHEDWVRGLDVLDIDNSTILLASASQDTYIRLWRIQHHVEEPTTGGIRVEQKLFVAHETNWSVKLDAVLAGHEGWVYGVQWHPCRSDKDTNKRLPVFRLLSSSLDKTLIVWEPDSSPTRGEGEGAWVERIRVGEVGGNGLGFYGSRFGPNGKSFMGHGYNGSFHIWSVCEETGQWEPQVVCGGHFGGVQAVRWEARGRYLTSAAADQTTRLHAPWLLPNGQGTEWHEIGRPQVHGYDMAGLAIVSSTVYASAAEEKVIRVFRAPHNFLQNFKNIVGEELDGDTEGPEGASVPSLGLSNKAVFNDTEQAEDDGYFVPVDLKAPPTEETLQQNTLWPETHKLYGHGYEVYALAATTTSPGLLASACRATTAEHAAVLIWETSNWQQIQKLVSHQLTVTQLEFSPDGLRLLSVSRDRRWTLYQRQEGSKWFDTVATTDKSNGVHARIIWCCAWAHDGRVFGTGSRDGKVCVWSKTECQPNPQSSLGQYALHGKPLELANTSVTALAFAPTLLGDARVVATGFESGVVRLYSFQTDGWSLLYELNNSAAHHLTVKQLAFRPRHEDGDDKRLLLASCGSDHLVRIHSVAIS
ncbi:elongator complex protein 2 [Galleria mellonella]|uniref:Elongator complex protein 2 n=1 Tax=Galleria mellonella TaxID=7137 RepID=A0ABM3MRF0_GALME|nr:elongator complex protein 2 [Galleria mellonella]